MDAKLAGPTDLAGFRMEALQLLAHQVPPEAVHWLVLDIHPGSPLPGDLPPRPRNVPRAVAAIVPASFQRLCELVVLHRDPERFALLYRLLWRLVHEPLLRGDPIDADMLHAQHLGHAVRRDILKLKTHLRMRAVADAEHGDAQMGCHDPAHHILEAVTPWLAQRLTAPRWALFTPDRSVCSLDKHLTYGSGVPLHQFPAYEAADQVWLSCHAKVFGATMPRMPGA